MTLATYRRQTGSKLLVAALGARPPAATGHAAQRGAAGVTVNGYLLANAAIASCLIAAHS